MLPQFGTHTITAIIINKIEMIQHRAACFVLDCPWRRDLRDSITSMLPSLGWPSLQLRRKCAIDLLYCLIFFITSWRFPLNISQYHRQWPQQEETMISSFCITRPLLTATSSLFIQEQFQSGILSHHSYIVNEQTLDSFKKSLYQYCNIIIIAS